MSGLTLRDTTASTVSARKSAGSGRARLTGLPRVPLRVVPGERSAADASREPLLGTEAPPSRVRMAGVAEFATGFGRVLGASPAMQRLYPLCRRLADSSVSVVIGGETGTGKEVLAESLHEAGPRRDRPFVVFDCTATPRGLVESALFGHERGAFTGATESRRGLFEEAHGGTLLIDEIGDLDLELQAKLLRVLERGEVRRLGGNRWVKIDVRIISATRRDLCAEVRAGRFRDDLFYRLAVTRLELPALRDRGEDLEVLARHFWARHAQDGSELPEDFAAELRQRSWPGNVRELQNAVARRVALGDLSDDLQPVHPQACIDPPGAPAMQGESGDDPIARILALGLPLTRSRQLLVAEFERRYVERALDEHGGNVARAAATAGIARRYFRLLRARVRGGILDGLFEGDDAGCCEGGEL